MTTITFVRHAQSVTNAGERWPDPYTIPLSEVGIAQTELLARDLPDAEIVLFSAMTRTHQTIAPYLARRPSTRSMVLSDLNEMRDLDWKSLVDVSSAGIRSALETWWNHPDPHDALGGEESFAEMHARATRVISSWEQCGWQSLIVVSHANFLRLIKCLLDQKISGSLADQKRTYYGLRRDIYVGNASSCTATRSNNTWTTTEFRPL